MDIRMCRFCGKDETEVRFYDLGTTSATAAGRCCAPCWINASVAWRHANRARWNAQRHRTQSKKLYGVNDEEYDRLYAGTPKCWGCGATASTNQGKPSRLVIDHDHATGKVRGLLCHNCNRTIATAHDNPAILRALAIYLEKDE